MSRIKKIIRNILIIVILSFIIMNRLGLYLTPLSAHENSERSLHYGPSKVIHIEDFKNGKYILGKYDKWVSCDTINRVWFFFWCPGGQTIGFENDKAKAVCCTWSYSNQIYRVYGTVNDKNVKKIEITLSNGEVLTQLDFYEDLFLLTWKSKQNENKIMKCIRGYDSESNMIFEEEY